MSAMLASTSYANVTVPSSSSSDGRVRPVLGTNGRHQPIHSQSLRNVSTVLRTQKAELPQQLKRAKSGQRARLRSRCVPSQSTLAYKSINSIASIILPFQGCANVTEALQPSLAQGAQ